MSIQHKVARLFRSIAFRLDPPQETPGEFRGSWVIFKDLEPEFKAYYDRCIDFTMTPVEHLYAQYTAINYVVAAGIPGAIVECGVWRGGSSMMAALRLKALGDTTRKLYLYDTFVGMSQPKPEDVNVFGNPAAHKWEKSVGEDKNLWAYSPLDEVQRNMHSTGYPEDQIQFIKGKVEDTIPATVPDRIALLRLDTDWFESTYHELVHLYPRLEPGGMLIIDDYGHWEGCRKAVDQFMAENKLALCLHRVTYAGRVAIKTKPLTGNSQ